MATGELNTLTWVDSAGPDGWRFWSDEKNNTKCKTVTTVGFIQQEDEYQVVVCPHLIDEGDDWQGCGILVIPKVAILKRQRLVNAQAQPD